MSEPKRTANASAERKIFFRPKADPPRAELKTYLIDALYRSNIGCSKYEARRLSGERVARDERQPLPFFPKIDNGRWIFDILLFDRNDAIEICVSASGNADRVALLELGDFVERFVHLVPHDGQTGRVSENKHVAILTETGRINIADRSVLQIFIEHLYVFAFNILHRQVHVDYRYLDPLRCDSAHRRRRITVQLRERRS